MLWFVWSELPAFAASFDCGKASTAQEKAICADSKLSKLDEDTAAAYKEMRAQLSPAGAAKVQQDQREWLVWLRQVCPDRDDPRRRMIDCLRNQYSARLSMLQNGVRRVGGITFFSRLKVVTMLSKEKPVSSADPGFGVGWFRWPEIDQPTARQAAWNAAVRRQTVAMTLEPENRRRPPADFEPSSVAGADVTVFYRLKAVNERLIAVNLENGSYYYGAAHPNEFTVSFQWWMELGRALKAEDVFKPGSGWEAFLARRCYEKLTTGEHQKDLYDDKNVRESAAESVKQVSGWTLDARKFQVAFAEYSVAPRVAGPISVELGWQELRPYLASTFDPASLPQPIPPREQ